MKAKEFIRESESRILHIIQKHTGQRINSMAKGVLGKIWDSKGEFSVSDIEWVVSSWGIDRVACKSIAEDVYRELG